MKIMVFRYVVLSVILAPIAIPGCCCIGRYWLAMNADLPVRNVALTETVEIQLDSKRRVILPKGLVLRSLDKNETDPLYPDTETFKIYVSSRGLKVIPLDPTTSDTNLIYSLNCQKMTGLDYGN